MGKWFSPERLSSFLLATAAFTAMSAIGYRAAFAQRSAEPSYEALTDANAQSMFVEGRKIFRFETFGDEAFWGQTLQLHQAVQGSKFGGIGGGLSPKAALAAGLKVDAAALPADLVAAIRSGAVDLDDPATTLALLKLNAVVGVKGTFDASGRRLVTVGITCASCHSTVDNSFAPGIGRRLDGWPNRDLNVGAIIALSPDLSAVNKLLGVDDATTRKVLASWGPGKYDAEIFLDGRAFRPDGRSAATLLPAAYGLAGVNLHTYTGWGAVPYWNAFVAKLEMHGVGRFSDARLNDPSKFPVAVRAGFANVKGQPDHITKNLPALHYYQMSLPAPAPPEGSFDKAAAARGERNFMAGSGKTSCASCHTPPTFTDTGWNIHTPEEIGIDDFQARRSPSWFINGKEVVGYRTTPLKGLWSRQKGGFYHDGRFATLMDVVNHYDRHMKLGLTPSQKADLVEYLKSL
jgi:cytochrome c553